MTLNGVITVILRFLAEFGTALRADYVKVVEGSLYSLDKNVVQRI